ncbi:hypothetical protein OBBRIDRAFT_805875 [Obba rivulosa]|uniref:Uncharacterized protein n=1 Tax=Obba rivulosa TaxID=1052685 RepID=A0A8E2AYD0_9APHY|nr:hypothetical protein OBBRIDRAFT_805875 [Obba rivulosa]
MIDSALSWATWAWTFHNSDATDRDLDLSWDEDNNLDDTEKIPTSSEPDIEQDSGAQRLAASGSGSPGQDIKHDAISILGTQAEETVAAVEGIVQVAHRVSRTSESDFLHLASMQCTLRVAATWRFSSAWYTGSASARIRSWYDGGVFNAHWHAVKLSHSGIIIAVQEHLTILLHPQGTRTAQAWRNMDVNSGNWEHPGDSSREWDVKDTTCILQYLETSGSATQL